MENITGWVLALMFAGIVAISYVLAQVWLWLCGYVKSGFSARVMASEPYTSMCDRVIDARLALENYIRVYHIRAFDEAHGLLFTAYAIMEPRVDDVIVVNYADVNAKHFVVTSLFGRTINTHRNQVVTVEVDVMVAAVEEDGA